MTAPRVAVVVPVHNRLPHTRGFLDSFRRVDYPALKVVIVDDGSRDGTAEMVAREHPEARLIRGTGNLWWSGGTNLGVRWALHNRFDYVLTINDDTVVKPDFLSRLVACAQAHPRSIVGCRINMQDKPGHVWAAGGRLLWHEGELFTLYAHDVEESRLLAELPNPLPTDILTGCGTLVPAECYERIGLYDARNCPQYHADSEFILRASKHGWRAFVALDAVVWNDHKASWQMRKPTEMLFHKRSPWYWRASLSIYLRYCPPHHRLRTIKGQIRRVLDIIRRRTPRAARARTMESFGPRPA